jgi:hypothetical protein
LSPPTRTRLDFNFINRLAEIAIQAGDGDGLFPVAMAMAKYRQPSSTKPPSVANLKAANDFGCEWVVWLYARWCLDEAKSLMQTADGASLGEKM